MNTTVLDLKKEKNKNKKHENIHERSENNMTVNKLIENLDLEVVNLADGELPVTGGYVCDLLSWVIGRTGENDAWITVMTNINTVAVALLAGISCIILSEDVELDENAKQKAVSEGINVLKSPKNSFELAYELGKQLNHE